MPSLEPVRYALREIVIGNNCSIAVAAALETVIASSFAQDERFDDLVHILASYRPSGGDFLFDEAALKAEANRVLKLIESV